MKLKTKTIKLKAATVYDPHAASPTGTMTVWKVESVTNATTPMPGETLTKKQVDELCDAKDWTVTITGK